MNIKTFVMLRMYFLILTLLIVSILGCADSVQYDSTYHNEQTFSTSPIGDDSYTQLLNNLTTKTNQNDTVLLGLVLNDDKAKIDKHINFLLSAGKIKFVLEDSIYTLNNNPREIYQKYGGNIFEFSYDSVNYCKAIIYNEFKNDTLKQVRLIFVDYPDFESLADFIKKKYGNPLIKLFPNHFDDNVQIEETKYIWIKDGYEILLLRNHKVNRFGAPSTEIMYTDLKERKRIENENQKREKEIMESLIKSNQENARIDSLNKVKKEKSIDDF